MVESSSSLSQTERVQTIIDNLCKQLDVADQELGVTVLTQLSSRFENLTESSEDQQQQLRTSSEQEQTTTDDALSQKDTSTIESTTKLSNEFLKIPLVFSDDDKQRVILCMIAQIAINEYAERNRKNKEAKDFVSILKQAQNKLNQRLQSYQDLQNVSQKKEEVKKVQNQEETKDTSSTVEQEDEEETKISENESKNKKLNILIDIGGSLLYRTQQRMGVSHDYKVGKKLHFFRPGHVWFLNKLFSHDSVRLWIYTSITQKFATPLIQKILDHKDLKQYAQSSIEDLFDGQFCPKIKESEEYAKLGIKIDNDWETYRDLKPIFESYKGKEFGLNASNTLLLDSESLKVQVCLENSLIIPEYTAEHVSLSLEPEHQMDHQKMFEELWDYLSKIIESNSDDVAKFIKTNPPIQGKYDFIPKRLEPISEEELEKRKKESSAFHDLQQKELTKLVEKIIIELVQLNNSQDY